MNSYWRERAIEREAHWYDETTQELEEKVKRYYLEALEKIRLEIESLFARYASENGLNMVEARRLIRGGEYQRWRKSLEEYVREAEKDSEILKELNTLAMRSRINRLEALNGRTLIEIDKLSTKTADLLTVLMSKAYEDNYYRSLYEIHKGFGLSTPPVVLSTEKVTDVLRENWSGYDYSTRIWKNGYKLGEELKELMPRAIHRGLSVKKMSEELTGRFKVKYNEAERLIRTELNYIQNRGAIDSIEASGLGYYQYIAALDRRTCTRCGHLDGEIIPLTEKEQGENAPPLHPRCRCTICAALGERLPVKRKSRIAEGRTKIGDVSYSEWRAGLEKVAPLQREQAAIKDNGERNRYTVNFAHMNSKAYHDKFEDLTAHRSVNEGLYRQATKILSHRSGTEYEDIAMLDARTGKVLVENNSAAEIYKFQCGLTKKQDDFLRTGGKTVEILHNHPNSSVPSTADIIGLYSRKYATASTVICHDGTVYRMEKLKPFDAIKELTEQIYAVKSREMAGYPDHMIESKVSREVIKLLAQKGVMRFKELN